LRRRTLKGEISFQGKGLHSGKPAELTLRPYQGKGYVFSFQGGNSFELQQGSFSGDGRGVSISFASGRSIKTPEHLLSSLSGHGIDDVEIIIDSGDEIPAMDGSALEFSSSILKIGTVEKEDLKDPIAIPVPYGKECPDHNSMMWFFPYEGFKITCVIDFPGTLIGTSCLSIEVDPSVFHSEIAPARTFALSTEISSLKERGLARGGSLENAILVKEDRILASGGLRYRDEFVRHKILDIIGDLALLGRPLRAHVFAFRTGHRTHVDLVERLSSLFR